MKKDVVKDEIKNELNFKERIIVTVLSMIFENVPKIFKHKP